MGVHHSTDCRWKDLAERHGLECCDRASGGQPRLPNQIPAMVEERILAFSLGQAGLGSKRIAAA